MSREGTKKNLMETAQQNSVKFAAILQKVRLGLGDEFEAIMRQCIEIPIELWMKWESGKFDDEDAASWRRTLIQCARTPRLFKVFDSVVNPRPYLEYVRFVRVLHEGVEQVAFVMHEDETSITVYFWGGHKHGWRIEPKGGTRILKKNIVRAVEDPTFYGKPEGHVG